MKTKTQAIKKTKLKSLKLKNDEIKYESNVYRDFEEENEDSFDETTLSDQETIYKTTFINEEDSLKRKIKELYLNMDWIERMDLIVNNNDELNKLKEKDLIYNDFQRENYFHKQALIAVSQALPKLNSLGIQTNRPGDLHANLTKSDQHMKKINEKLVNDHFEVEKKEEKTDQIREMKNLGKLIKQQAEIDKQEFKKSNKILKVDKQNIKK
jgi:hypothetical protein